MGIEYPAPDQAIYGGITPEKYNALEVALKADPKASNLVIADDSGSVTHDGVDFSWTYDGSANVTITIAKVHNWKAKIAGNQAIFGILNDELFSKL